MLAHGAAVRLAGDEQKKDCRAVLFASARAWPQSFSNALLTSASTSAPTRAASASTQG